MTALLQLTDIDAGYGARVLHGVSLTVRAGEAWVVLGPNGAGKSTLVRVALGLLAPMRGDARLCGEALSTLDAREVAKRAAWVPQVVDDTSRFTGLEVALMGRAPHLSAWGVPGAADEARALEALKTLDVAHVAHRPLAEVSGGERRRVWLARALVQTPKLLVLDEPTAFLDVRHQVEMLRHVRALVDGGLGALAVLHDVNLARHLATHVLLMKDGRAVAQGRAEDVLTAAALTQLYGVEMHEAPGFAPRWETP